MMEVLAIATVVLLTVVIILLIAILLKSSKSDSLIATTRLDAIEKTQDRIERSIRDEMSTIRGEINKGERDQRQELSETMKRLGDSLLQSVSEASGAQKGQLEDFTKKLNYFAEASGERLDGVRGETAAGAKQIGRAHG